MADLRDRPAAEPDRHRYAEAGERLEREVRGRPDDRRGHRIRNVDICGNPVDGTPDQAREQRRTRGEGHRIRRVDICGNPLDEPGRRPDRPGAPEGDGPDRRGPGGSADRPDGGAEGSPPGSGGGDRPERPAAGGDEPGSWRGESGRYLNFEEHLVARHNIDRMREIEPRVTENLRAIESDVPGASMVGLEYRLKGDDRLKDKIAKENRDTPEKNLREISEDIPDAIRYTYQFDAADYARGYHDVCARLEAAGYTLTHSANSWDSPDYKGINTRWRTPDGPLFEVQFHTPESFETKQRTHDLYETIRNPAVPREERMQARATQREISAQVPKPAGVETIESFRS